MTWKKKKKTVKWQWKYKKTTKLKDSKTSENTTNDKKDIRLGNLQKQDDKE